jgi:hypothetical protein
MTGAALSGLLRRAIEDGRVNPGAALNETGDVAVARMRHLHGRQAGPRRHATRHDQDVALAHTVRGRRGV